MRRGKNEGDDKSGLSLLKFFAVASPQAWDSYYKDARLKVAFRISLADVKDPYAMSAWIRRGEILSDQDPMEKLGQPAVRKNLKVALPEIIAFAAANKVRPKGKKRITYWTPEAHVLYHGKKGICLQNIEITHNYPEKEDEANAFAQKCMADAGFKM